MLRDGDGLALVLMLAFLIVGVVAGYGMGNERRPAQTVGSVEK